MAVVIDREFCLLQCGEYLVSSAQTQIPVYASLRKLPFYNFYSQGVVAPLPEESVKSVVSHGESASEDFAHISEEHFRTAPLTTQFLDSYRRKSVIVSAPLPVQGLQFIDAVKIALLGDSLALKNHRENIETVMSIA